MMSPQMTAVSLLFLIADLNYVLSSVVKTITTDLTLIPYAHGADVVDACTQKIIQKGLFRDDQRLLERIALTESGYTYNNKSNGGIWQLTPEHFERTKDQISPYLEESVKRVYGYEWKSMKLHNLTTPFLSALAARIYVNQTLQRIPLSSDIMGQAVYWANNYTHGLHREEKYIESVKYLSKREGCSSNKLDLIYILCVSSRQEFAMVKQLLSNLTRTFFINQTSTRIGLVSYQKQTNFTFSLKDFFSVSSVVSAIDKTSFLSPTSTWMDEALTFVYNDGFNKKNGARDATRAIPRAVVVITDQVANLTMINKKEVLTYVLGIGANLSLNQLRELASSPSNARISENMDINELNEFKEKVSYDLRKTSTEVPINGTVLDILGPNQVKNFNYPFPQEGLTLRLHHGNEGVILYASNWIYNPNSAAHDLKFEGAVTSEVYIDHSFLDYRLSTNRLFITVTNNHPNASCSLQFTAKLGDDRGVPPKIMALFDMTETKHSNTVLSIICEVTGNPLPTITFYRDDTLLKNGSHVKISYHIQSTRINKALLQIYSPSEKDKGTYICMGSNVFFNGSSFLSRSSVRLVVIGSKGKFGCSPPENLHASRHGNDVYIAWSTPKYMSGPISDYVMFYRIVDENCTANSDNLKGWHFVLINKTSVLMQELHEQCTYEFIVQARTQHGSSANSSNITILIPAEEPKFQPDNGPKSIAMMVGSLILLVFITIIMTTLVSLYIHKTVTAIKRAHHQLLDDNQTIEENSSKQM